MGGWRLDSVTAGWAEAGWGPRPSEWTAAEQAALRRLATLVAGGASPEAVFTAVSAKVGRPLGVDLTVMARYDQGSAATVVGAWSSTGADVPGPRPGRAWAGTTCPPWCFTPTARRGSTTMPLPPGAISDIARDWGAPRRRRHRSTSRAGCGVS